VQYHHAPGDKEHNWTRIRSFVRQAEDQGVDLLVFPEMCITGYWHVRQLPRSEVVELSERIPHGPSSQELLSISSRTGMTIGAGLIERSREDVLFNAYLVAMPDGQYAVHRKLHCFISAHMASGDAYTVIDIPQGARVGVLICYDNNIGENVRANALMGAEVLLAPHQTGGCDSPSPRCMGRIDPQLWRDREHDPDAIEAEFRGPKGREWLLHWLPARAHDNGIFLVYANGVGLDDDEVRTGNAMILDPYGDILVETWRAADEMVVADLDPELIPMSTGRRWIQTRRPELYGLLVRRTGIESDTRTVRFKRGPGDIA
jgi:predicted amidohydrolase